VRLAGKNADKTSTKDVSAQMSCFFPLPYCYLLALGFNPAMVQDDFDPFDISDYVNFDI
jgi:hypothetical protein